MADVTISYNNADIVELSDNDEIILDTAGKSMADDITVKYVKPVPQMQAKSVSPTTSTQTITPDSGYDGLSSVSVLPIYPQKSAQTYTPNTSNQVIQSGRWLIGNQTILGDANLVAGNIKKDVSIFGVTGTYEGSGGGGGGSTARYEIKISLTNPSSVYNFGQCNVFTFSSQFDPFNPDGPLYNATRLVNVYNADESFDVYVPTDIWGIWVQLDGGGPDGAEYGTCSVTGSLTVDPRYESGYEGWIIQVSGDGTITIDGAEYDP